MNKELMRKVCFSGLVALFLMSCSHTNIREGNKVDPVDYVKPYMGNISHLLVPTFPTMHLPNSMMRVYPERRDFTADLLNGLPLITTSHRGSSAFIWSRRALYEGFRDSGASACCRGVFQRLLSTAQ